MLLRRHKPGPALAPHVEYLWYLRDAPSHTAESVLPTGTLELVINLAHDSFQIRTHADVQTQSGALVSGAHERYFTIDTRDHHALLGVHFKPGGAWPVLGVAPGDLQDQHCDLENLWGPGAARSLREQLIGTPAQQRLAVLERLLSARCASSWQLQPSCVHALRALERGERVHDVASAVGLSARRLQSVFRESVGTTPKIYARLRRFQRVLQRHDRGRPWELADLALASGYCDQSHMIRDFQAIAGCAPSELFRAQAAPVKDHHLAQPSDLSKTLRARRPMS